MRGAKHYKAVVNSSASRAPGEDQGDAAAVLGGALRYLPTRVVPALFGMAATPVLTNTLHREGYGRYTLLVLVASYASVVFGEWIIAGYQRYILSADAQEKRAAEEAFAWLAIVLALGSLVAVPVLAIWNVNVLELAAAVSLTWGLTLFQLVVTGLVMVERPTFATAVQVAASTARFLIMVWAAMAFRSAAAVVLGSGSCLLLICSVLLRNSQHPMGRPQAQSFRILSSFGGFMVVTSIALNGLSTADRFLLAGLTDASTVGRYSASYLLAEQAVLVLPSVLILAITPRVTSLWEMGRRSEAGALTTAVALLHVELCFPVVLGMAMFGRDITRFALGPGFAEGAVPPIVALAAVFLAVSTYANFGLRMQKRSRRQAVQSIVALALNIALVLMLVPSFGARGAAVATLIAYTFVAAWSVIDNRWFVDARRLAAGAATIAAPAGAVLAVYAVAGRSPVLTVAIAVYAAVAARRIHHRLRLTIGGRL